MARRALGLILFALVFSLATFDLWATNTYVCQAHIFVELNPYFTCGLNGYLKTWAILGLLFVASLRFKLGRMIMGVMLGLYILLFAHELSLIMF